MSNKGGSKFEGSIKSKLDSIWSELQTNLPTMSFDNTDNNSSNGSEPNAYDEMIIDENNFKFDDKEHDYFIVEADETIEATTKQLSVNKHVLKCVEIATEITKNIFDSTSSKLNMDLFNQIDLGDDIDEITDQFDIDSIKAEKVSNKQKDIDNEILERLQSFTLQHVNGSKSKVQDLNKTSGLKYNNQPCGNQIETKRIDLRQSNVQTKNDNCFKKMLNELNSLNGFEFKSNQSQSSTDSESDADDDGKILWIERYRNHKGKTNNASSQ